MFKFSSLLVQAFCALLKSPTRLAAKNTVLRRQFTQAPKAMGLTNSVELYPVFRWTVLGLR
jgi:hypothetical protein